VGVKTVGEDGTCSWPPNRTALRTVHVWKGVKICSGGSNTPSTPPVCGALCAKPGGTEAEKGRPVYRNLIHQSVLERAMLERGGGPHQDSALARGHRDIPAAGPAAAAGRLVPARRPPRVPVGPRLLIPPFWAVKRPVHPHKRATQNVFPTGNAKAA
jgi:hypothetical protein